MEKNKYTLYWLTGKKEVVNGNSISDAMTNSGYGAGAIRALDFYENGVDDSYEWEDHEWVKRGD